MSQSKSLFSARTTDGNGTAVACNFSTQQCQIWAWGTWNGASLKFQFSPDGTAWVDIKDSLGNTVTVTADRGFTINVAYNEQIRGVLSSSGGSTSISAKIIEVGRG